MPVWSTTSKQRCVYVAEGYIYCSCLSGSLYRVPLPKEEEQPLERESMVRMKLLLTQGWSV